ncbi:hypothetical protein [Caulobacter mirabilis]|uniref:DUF2306 domain-containing protein n=1 Tax=Caulobacter mirabilis TaxID=69666 RepID=A0A2D2AX00_9CAUL|nr:hypothetical protein [Caulobacter mirabilis]ATQ42505.1 hypothetical protein CSW64_08795 [Caulobacter mirabilis]
MDLLFKPALVLHVGCGLLATLGGLAPLLTRKGSRAHRLSGRVFAGLMAVLLVCAWLMTALRFSAYFTALSATATLGLVSGLRVLGRKRPDLRAGDRARPIDWAVTLAAVGVGLWILALLANGRTGGGGVAVTMALATSALLLGGWDLWRFLRPTDWPFSPDLWTYEHLAKMLGAYSAVLSAFSGNFLTALPTPWSQLWPSILFQVLAIGWITVLAARRRRGLASA